VWSVVAYYSLLYSIHETDRQTGFVLITWTRRSSPQNRQLLGREELEQTGSGLCSMIRFCDEATKFIRRKGTVSTNTYSDRDQTVHFANVTSLRVEGKQTHILCKPKTLRETASYKNYIWVKKKEFGQKILPYLLPFPPL
jgi:hypothetical protein